MDLVECEAPLDSSFQKDRLELVNKGSLGRRRKPSRSNLRFILSPANDQQDIDVFHNHQQFESEGSFIQENGTSSNSFTESVLDNQQESVIGVSDRRKNFSDYQKKDNCPKNSRENGIVNNYRDVVESINQIYKAKCIDFNGNSHQRVVTSRYHQNYTSGDSVHVVQNGDQKVKSENNNVSSKHNLQTSVIRNQQASDANSYQVFTKLNNSNHVTKSSTCHSTFATKNQNASESKSCQQTSNIRNQQNKERKASSNNHQNIITFSNHRQIVTSTPVQTRSTVPNGKHQERIPPKDCSSKLYIESSLPRTSKEPSLVAEAQQFSIEAKLKRKKSEVQGRSAVLIQTWERRTQSESYSKIRSYSKTIQKNRFSDREIFDANSTAMPDSYICVKYKGSLQNGDNLLKGELVPNVRGAATFSYWRANISIL